MATSACVSCGRPADPTGPCPYCGHDPLAIELARLDQDIAEMSAQDMRLQNEIKDLAAKMQAAQHQRVILAHTKQEQQRRATPKPRSVLRRRPPHIKPEPGLKYEASDRSSTSSAKRPPRQPYRSQAPQGVRGEGPPPRPGGSFRAEASFASVQDILLILGALLLAVAAVVFSVLARNVLDSVSRAGVLLFATILMLAVPRVVARRALFATAETIAALGLLLLPLDGYALWTIEQLGLRALPGSFFAGLVFATTVVVAAVYMTLSRLTVPRYAIVLAIQPVLPLLAFPLIAGPAGWALAFAAVAAIDASLGGMLGQVPKPGTRRRLAVAAATFWLRELIWLLHTIALVGALLYATVALITADSVPAALRGAATLLLAAMTGLYAALQLRRRPLPDAAAALVTIAVVASASRVAAVALPGRALILVTAAVTAAGLGVRALPNWARRGPQIASALTLAVLGAVVAGNALRTAIATVRSALPMWRADLSPPAGKLADAVGPAGWQLVATAVLLIAAAYLVLPLTVRREGTIAGVAIASLAGPAALGLDWVAAAWLLVAVAIVIGFAGLSSRTVRVAATHTVAAGLVALVGAGAALARSNLTAAVLAVLAIASGLLAAAQRMRSRANATTPGEPTRILGNWAAGMAAFAMPCAVGAAAASATQTAASALVLAFVATCASLGYAAINQVAHRQVNLPLAAGSGLATMIIATAVFRTSTTAADTWVAALLLAGAVLLFLAPSIDAARRADRVLDGADIAAGVIATATVASLARIGALALPSSELATAAALVLVVSLWIRALPEEWRRGPIVGCSVSGAVIAAIAGSVALRDGVRVLALPGRIWAADLDAWPANPADGSNWQAPAALLLLAAAAAVVLPKPAAYRVAAIGVGAATVGTPLALGLAWWSPIAVGGVVAAVYGVSSVLARDPKAGIARAALAICLALYTAGAGLVRPWTTAAALSLIVLLGTTVAGLAVLVARLDLGIVDDTVPGGTAHLPVIGGLAVTGALLAFPGAVAAIAADLGHPAGMVLTAALGACGIGLATVAAARRQVPQYLGYATAGVAGAATIIAVAALPTHQPVGLYAAGAVLLGVLAELQRAKAVGPDGQGGETGWWRSTFAAGDDEPVRGGLFVSGLLSSGSQGAQRTADSMVQVSDGMLRRWRLGPVRQFSISPVRGALAIAALPTALALVTIVPALLAALADPYQTLDSVWHGPPAALSEPAGGDSSSVLAALLLTTAAAIAAIGFAGGALVQAVPVILPGLAITLLIAPVGLRAGWPASTIACLIVFTISTLGVALTPPPPETERARPARTARYLVFVIGLMAGGAALAGSLANELMTVSALGGAACVGTVAALAGRTPVARILGWLFAAVAAQGFLLTLGHFAGLPLRVSAFGVLATGAGLLVLAAALPRLRRPEFYQETATVEWSGYAAALLALALAIDSALHVAAMLAAWGAVLGLSATRPNRQPTERRTLFWTAVGCEVGAWWLLMRLSEVVLIEAYTLPFAVLALLVGVLETRHRPDLSSWAAYGPALVAAFLPTLTTVLFGSATAPRQVGLLLGAVAVLIAGSMRRQQAPVIVGAVVTTVAALRLLTEYGPWLMLIPVGLTLLAVGANYEKRRRDLQRLRATLTSFR